MANTAKLDRRSLVTENYGLVWRMIHLWWLKANLQAIYGTEEDAFQDGVIGLMNAARLYDPNHGPFSTYACRAVLNRFKGSFSKRLIHVPSHVYSKNNASENQRTLIAFANQARNICTISADEDDDNASEWLAAKEPPDNSEDIVLARSMLQFLPTDLMRLMQLSFGIGCRAHSITEIARLRGLTIQRVKQLKDRSINLIRLLSVGKAIILEVPKDRSERVAELTFTTNNEPLHGYSSRWLNVQGCNDTSPDKMLKVYCKLGWCRIQKIANWAALADATIIPWQLGYRYEAI